MGKSRFAKIRTLWQKLDVSIHEDGWPKRLTGVLILTNDT
jgi:hypothetical protein